MKKQVNISFILAKITTEQFAIIEEGFIETQEIEIRTNIRFAADKNQQLIGVFTFFSFESMKKPFLIIEAGGHFKIADDAWAEMLSNEELELTVPKGFLQHMAMLTVGTARGILHAKTENTPFNKFHLPTINVADLIQKDSVFTFSTVK